MTELSTAAYALLGLISRRPSGASGYELSSFAERSLGWFWPVPRSVIYRQLPLLEADALVVGSDIAQQHAPDKRVYHLTAAGEQALDAWLAEPHVETGPTRDGFLLKFFFAQRLSPSAVADLIASQRESLIRDRDDLDATVALLSARPQSQFGRLSARYGLMRVEATLAWLDEVEAALSLSSPPTPPPGEAAPH